jgi:hypothetical protein
MFLHLPVDQIHCYLLSKGFAPTTPHSSPVSKMGGERIEVHIEAITRENWEAARRQDLSQGVNDTMRRALRARTKLKNRKNLGEGLNGQPEPRTCLALRSRVRSSSSWRCGSSARARFAHAPLRVSQVVMVA